MKNYLIRFSCVLIISSQFFLCLGCYTKQDAENAEKVISTPKDPILGGIVAPKISLEFIKKTWLTQSCKNMSPADGGGLYSTRKKYEIGDSLIKVTQTMYPGSSICDEAKKGEEGMDSYEYTLDTFTGRAELKWTQGSDEPDRHTLYFFQESDCLSIGFSDGIDDYAGDLYCTDLNSPTFVALKSCITEITGPSKTIGENGKIITGAMKTFCSSRSTTIDNCKIICKQCFLVSASDSIKCKFDDKYIE